VQAEAHRVHATVDGWTINVPDQNVAVETICRAASERRGFTVYTLNLDHLVKLRSDAAFRRAYGSATFVTADGEPVARLARRRRPEIRRTTGADLVLPLANACADQNIPVYLFGTSPGVLASAGERLVRNTGGRLDIAGSSSPAVGFDPEGPSADRAIEQIKRSGAKICFIALGAPKQEIFAARAVASGADLGFVCIGAALDFLAGEQIRAPQIFQSLHLEWLWRLGSNPRRLAVRYAKCAALLGQLVLLEPFAGSMHRPPVS
jgi:exopolysaccharide biosynthesis WecB/TagA/CpsF family protein